MKKKIFIVSLVCFCFFSACEYSNEFQEIAVGNRYALSVPAYMEPEDELLDEATFQYANRYRNLYVIALDTPKAAIQQGFDEYHRGAISLIKNFIDQPRTSDSLQTQIGGLNGIAVNIYGKITEEKVFYHHLTLEGEARFYQICVWTRGQERELKYKEDIEKILHSFREL